MGTRSGKATSKGCDRQVDPAGNCQQTLNPRRHSQRVSGSFNTNKRDLLNKMSCFSCEEVEEACVVSVSKASFCLSWTRDGSQVTKASTSAFVLAGPGQKLEFMKSNVMVYIHIHTYIEIGQCTVVQDSTTLSHRTGALDLEYCVHDVASCALRLGAPASSGTH